MKRFGDLIENLEETVGDLTGKATKTVGGLAGGAPRLQRALQVKSLKLQVVSQEESLGRQRDRLPLKELKPIIKGTKVGCGNRQRNEVKKKD